MEAFKKTDKERLIENRPAMGGGTQALFSLLYITIIGIPIVLIINKILASNVKKNLEAEAASKFGSFCNNCEYVYITINHSTELNGKGFTAYGIAADDNYLYLMEEGLAAKYEWENVRDSSYVIYDPSSSAKQAFSGPDEVALKNLSEGLGDALRLICASGISVEVQDIDKPLWRVVSLDNTQCQKWQEIIRQASAVDEKVA